MRDLGKPMCKIKTIEGRHFLCDPSGEKLPYQIMTRVTDELEKPTVAIIKLFVKIES